MPGLTGKRAIMDDSGSTKREVGSREPPDDGGLREIVERATHPGETASETAPKRRPRRYRPSRVLRMLIGDRKSVV